MAKETGEKKKKKRSPAKWFKETFSELKKVTWPTFPQVLKQTGVVLLVTLCFLVVLMAMDLLLGYLFGIFQDQINSTDALTFVVMPRLGALVSELGAVASNIGPIL